MNALEKILVGTITISLVGCGGRKEQPQEQPSFQTVQLSNGMSASGDVKTSSVTGAKSIQVPANGKMVVYDRGHGNVFVTYNGERLPNLTYTWNDQQFPVWEPYAFRESPEYHAIQSSLMVNGTWCPKEEKKEETKKDNKIPYSNF